MPIDSVHPCYKENVDLWTKCRDCIAGEEAVKKAGEKYLPRLEDQSDAEYWGYNFRAMFYGAASRTVAGLVGSIVKKPGVLEYPDSSKKDLDTIGLKGESFASISKLTLTETLGVGRYGLLVDAPEVPEGSSVKIKPYVTRYDAENIINWAEEKIGDELVVTLVVLREYSDSKDPEDKYKISGKEMIRELRLVDDANGNKKYEVQVFTKQEGRTPDGSQIINWVAGPTKTPTLPGGKALDRIPFKFFNPSDNGCEPERGPLLDLVNVNLSHYRTSADLEHGRHFTALPTAWVAGFDLKGTNRLKIGSSTAWMSDNPLAKAGFLEFTGAGLTALKEGLEEKRNLMAVLGARLLEDSRQGVETAEALRLRQAGQNSVLIDLAISCAEGLTQVLKWFAMWSAASEAEVNTIVFKYNLDFGVVLLSPQTIQALMLALQSGHISFSTWFHNLRRSDFIADDTTEDQERSRIEQGGPTSPDFEMFNPPPRPAASA